VPYGVVLVRVRVRVVDGRGADIENALCKVTAAKFTAKDEQGIIRKVVELPKRPLKRSWLRKVVELPKRPLKRSWLRQTLQQRNESRLPYSQYAFQQPVAPMGPQGQGNRPGGWKRRAGDLRSATELRAVPAQGGSARCASDRSGSTSPAKGRLSNVAAA